MKLDSSIYDRCELLRLEKEEVEDLISKRINQVINYLREKFPSIENWYTADYIDITDLSDETISINVNIGNKDREFFYTHQFFLRYDYGFNLLRNFPVKWLTEDFEPDIEAWLEEIRINKIL